MIDPSKDPMGRAILDFSKTKISKDIIVCSDICDDDVIPSAYLFRTYNEMPKIEQLALSQCKGKVIDVGAGAGSHAIYLKEKGLDISCIDVSPASIQYLKSIELNAEHKSFFDLNEQFDTLLMLMNGIGIAGTLSNLEFTLLHAKTCLAPGGKILCDSSDIKYLYEDEEGGMWIDLSAGYYGDFKFQMKFGSHTSEWFDWLYVDFENLKTIGERAGFEVRKLMDNENDQYLAELTLKT